jgi:hypothetical protein
MEFEPFGLYDWLKRYEDRPMKNVLAASAVKSVTLRELGAGPELFEGELGQHMATPFHPKLHEAVARAYGFPLERVIITLAGSEADLLAIWSTVKSGDKVVAESPYYQPLRSVPKALGAKVVTHQRTLKNKFRLDLGRLEEQLKGARLLTIANLNNPTGVGVSRRELEELRDIAARRRCTVLVDEAFREMSFDAPPVAASLGDEFVSTNTLTKSYGLGGLRTGWLLGPPKLVARALTAKNHTSVGQPLLEQRLAMLALEKREWLLQRAHRIRDANAAAMRACLSRQTKAGWVEPDGGGPVALRLPAGTNDVRFSERLAEEHDTFVSPCSVQGLPGHLRIGLGSDTEHLPRGLAAIGALL